MHAVLESLARLALHDAGRYAQAKRRNAGLYALAAVAGLTAYACAVVAGVLWLARHGDPVLAAGFAAVAFAALALAVLALVALLNRRDRRWMAERRASYAQALVTLTGASLGPRGLALVAAAALAGMVMERPHPPERPGERPAKPAGTPPQDRPPSG
ncbi:MAG: hypothetical protein ACK4LQ_05155 [Pararhodobacter sp.]